MTIKKRNEGRGELFEMLFQAFFDTYKTGAKSEYLDVKAIAADLDVSTAAVHYSVRAESVSRKLANALQSLEERTAGAVMVFTDEALAKLILKRKDK